MTKTTGTKRALWMSVLSLALCFAMLLGTTFAWFTDSAVSAGNIIKSGNFDVEMYWADGTEALPADENGWTDASAGAIFDYDLWEPGYAAVRHIKIANEGTLALKYAVRIVADGEVSDLAGDGRDYGLGRIQCHAYYIYIPLAVGQSHTAYYILTVFVKDVV